MTRSGVVRRRDRPLPGSAWEGLVRVVLVALPSIDARRALDGVLATGPPPPERGGRPARRQHAAARPGR